MYSGSCLCGDIAFVVDGPIEHVDQCHCSMCRKAHGLPEFEEYPPSFDFDTSTTQRPPRSAPTPGATGGSCLCGAVSFEYVGQPLAMANRHDRDSRLAMSAMFATIVTVRRTAFRWLSGERDIVRYAPGSNHAGSAFCRICGSPMPRPADADRMDIPAGCLDDDPGVRPTADLYADDETASTNLPCKQVQP